MKTTMQFLELLAKNNNRDWFQRNKNHYEKSELEMISLVEKLSAKVGEFDQLEIVSPKACLFRIYRDIRFSKDKTPYKVNRSGSFKRKGALRRGSYYFSIQPQNSLIGGGFYQPNAPDLKHIRQQIELDAQPLRSVLASVEFKSFYGGFQGETLKTAPRGFDPNHPEIDLLRRKHFYVMHQFSDQEVLQSDFVEKVSEGFRILLPFFEVMSNYLTTDLNGVPNL